MSSSLLQVVNNLFQQTSLLLQQTRNKQCENNLLTTCEQTCYNLFADLYNNLCVFTRVEDITRRCENMNFFRVVKIIVKTSSVASLTI